VSAPLEIRSFRSVFALERRIYRVDTLRLNPGGIPLRGVVYGALLIVAALIASAVPPTEWLDPLMPWYARDIGLPLAAATLLGSLRIEGRAFHLAGHALAAYALAPRHTNGLLARAGRERTWCPPPMLWIPDGSEGCFRALRYHGPGAVLVQHAHVRAEWAGRRRAGVTLHPLEGTCATGTALEMAAGAVLEVRRR
jgi:hypothetical protein